MKQNLIVLLLVAALCHTVSTKVIGLGVRQRRPHKKDDERSDDSHDLFKGDTSEKNSDKMSEFDKMNEDN